MVHLFVQVILAWIRKESYKNGILSYFYLNNLLYLDQWNHVYYCIDDWSIEAYQLRQKRIQYDQGYSVKELKVVKKVRDGIINILLFEFIYGIL